MRSEGHAREWFIGLWLLLLVARIAVAGHLPLFVDEAFYWQEGQHLAWAYSDLPGLTAWMTRLGTAIGGQKTRLRCARLSCSWRRHCRGWWFGSPRANSIASAAGRPACSRCCCRWRARWACSRSPTR